VIELLFLLAARETLGADGAWAAFREEGRCFAIAAPAISGGSGPAYAGVGSFPARGQRESLYLRLSRERDRARPVTLTVGERRFPLAATGRDAWAADAAAERAAVAAMRSARSMSVEAVAAGGRPFADTYRLDGAATAIDRATLACLE
jgi:hypothetical protein